MHQTLLEMHLPEFRRGYQTGRKHGLAGGYKVTDKDLLDAFYEITDSDGSAKVSRDDVAYTIGQFLGILSADIIPKQADECDTQEREQRFLAEIRTHDDAATLVGLIESFWNTQNELACLLDADLYERMLHRDSSCCPSGGM